MNSLERFYKENNKGASRLYTVGLLLLLLAVFTGLCVGSTSISLSELRYAFKNELKDTAVGQILLYVRIPRTIASLLCGAALAVSGTVIQAVLNNRLASPSIIGVNAGARLAVTLCCTAGVYGGWESSAAAFFGAFATVFAVSLGMRKWGGDGKTLILIGVALNSLLGAASDTVVTFIPDVGVMSNDFRVGEFSAVTLDKLLPIVVPVLITVIILLFLSNELEVFTLGEDSAKSLGMNTAFMRTVFLLCAAMLAGCAVSVAGLLSFVGLIVPHIVKRLAGTGTRNLIGLSAIFGAAFVCFCDTFARSAFSPYEIPVGIIMAFIGAPFFLFILIKRKGDKYGD